MPDNENLLHQIRFILIDAGTALSPYEIAYRLLTTKLQTSDTVELLRHQVAVVARHSPLHLLFQKGLVTPANWPENLNQTVLSVHATYYNALTPDYEDLPEWYEPVMLSLLCYKFLSDVEEAGIAEQCRFEFVLLHNRPSQWPEQLSESMRTIELSDPKVYVLFFVASQMIRHVNPSTLYQMVQQIQDADLGLTEPCAFILVVRKLFSDQIRKAKALKKNLS